MGKFYHFKIGTIKIHVIIKINIFLFLLSIFTLL